MHGVLKGLRAGLAAIAVSALLTIGSIAIIPLADASNSRMTATTAVNVRSGPGTNYAKIGLLYPGDQVDAISTQGEWTKVNFKGKTAWVASAFLQGSGNSAGDANNSRMTATSNVNVRSGPGTNHTRIDLLRKGDQVEAVRSNGDWTEVLWRGKTAWIASEFLKGSGTASTGPSSNNSKATGPATYTTANLNLRVGPSLNNSVFKVVPSGTKLALTNRTSGSYSQVSYQGRTLWAATSYLASSPAAPKGSLPKVSHKVRATTALMIRTAAGNNFQAVQTVPTGTILEATGAVSGDTAQVIWQGNVRWVDKHHIVKLSTGTAPTAPAVPKTTTQYATTNLNIWNAATGDAYSDLIPRGEVVAVTGKVSSGRAQVVHDGALRWVTAKYLSATKPATGAPGASTNTGSINKGWSSGLDKSNRFVQTIAWYVWNNYPLIKTQYGWRRDVTPDHPGGRAVDIMLPNYKDPAVNAQGWKMAEFFQANAKRFNISYIIFDQQIWSVARDSEGWRPMASRGSDNANHINHIHVNTYDD